MDEHMNLATIRKALVAGLAAGLSALATAAPDGVSAQELTFVIAAALVAGVAVFQVPNTPKTE